MTAVHPAGPVIGGLVSLVALWFSLRQRRRHRLLHDLPTSRVQGVFIGLVELEGTVESPAPLVSHLAGVRCVHHEWSVQEHWRRTRIEHYTDSKGNRRTRIVTDTGWDTVDAGGETADFYLRDDTGALLVRPEGARIEARGVFDQTVSLGHPLYYEKGPPDGVHGSTGQRRFVERALPLHAKIYLIGTARERADVVAPEIAAAPGAEFILSCRGEAAIKRGLAVGSWLTWVLAMVALPVGLHLGAQGAGAIRPSLAPVFIAGLFMLFAWAVGWVWMVHNSIIGLRERVRQGWSLIDVQLRRRRDLIPGLTAAVAALGAHEGTTKTALAALRAQAAATPPGAPGPDPGGLAPRLRAVVEAYPELRAAEGFAALQAELVATEQRIALARTYYNDIATHYATRLEIVPDRFIARLRNLRPEPLLTAENFERAAVQVNFAA